MSVELALAVVGGGPAAYSAARAYREIGGTGPVAILGAEQRSPYRRPPLTKEYLRGELGCAELPLASERWYAQAGIEVRSVEVTAVDPDRRELRTSDGDRFRWRRCVLATGSSPAVPAIEGIGLPGVQTMRTVEDSERLRSAAQDGPVVIVGSGFVACEAAASLAMLGGHATIVSDEPAPQEHRLGAAAAARIEAWLDELGVGRLLGERVEAIRAAAGGLAVEFGARSVEAETVLVATGIEPNTALAEAGGLELAELGGIAVDSSLRASAPNVFAAGDVACPLHPVAARRLRVEHWGEALAQGEIAGRNAAGQADEWRAAPGFWSTIGRHTIKHVAWGDGFGEAAFEERTDGSFAVRYRADGELVGVLSHRWDEAYEAGRAQLERRSDADA